MVAVKRRRPSARLCPANASTSESPRADRLAIESPTSRMSRCSRAPARSPRVPRGTPRRARRRGRAAGRSSGADRVRAAGRARSSRPPGSRCAPRREPIRLPPAARRSSTAVVTTYPRGWACLPTSALPRRLRGGGAPQERQGTPKPPPALAARGHGWPHGNPVSRPLIQRGQPKRRLASMRSGRAPRPRQVLRPRCRASPLPKVWLSGWRVGARHGGVDIVFSNAAARLAPDARGRSSSDRSWTPITFRPTTPARRPAGTSPRRPRSPSGGGPQPPPPSPPPPTTCPLGGLTRTGWVGWGVCPLGELTRLGWVA
jgi:hypothetical protein